MFRVVTPVFIVPNHEARRSLGATVDAAGLAAWKELARRRQGLEMAHFQIVHEGVTLAVSSSVRPDGCIEIEIGLGDPRQAARVIPAFELKRAGERARHRTALRR